MLIRGIYSQQRRRWMREIKIDRKFLSLNTSAHNLLSFSSSAFINILLFDHHHKKCIQRCCFSSRNNRYKKKSSNSHMRIVRCVHGVRYCLNKMQNCHKAKITHTFSPSSSTLAANTSSRRRRWSNFRIENLRYIYNYAQCVASDAKKRSMKRWYFKQLKLDVCIWESSTNRWKVEENIYRFIHSTVTVEALYHFSSFAIE